MWKGLKKIRYTLVVWWIFISKQKKVKKELKRTIESKTIFSTRSLNEIKNWKKLQHLGYYRQRLFFILSLFLSRFLNNIITWVDFLSLMRKCSQCVGYTLRECGNTQLAGYSTSHINHAKNDEQYEINRFVFVFVFKGVLKENQRILKSYKNFL